MQITPKKHQRNTEETPKKHRRNAKETPRKHQRITQERSRSVCCDCCASGLMYRFGLWRNTWKQLMTACATICAYSSKKALCAATAPPRVVIGKLSGSRIKHEPHY